MISIHALLAESDACMMGNQHARISNFYPRSPCGERLTYYAVTQSCAGIISIHALLAESDGASNNLQRHYALTISIHALLAESDIAYGRRIDVAAVIISIHALLAESDPYLTRIRQRAIIAAFLSTLSLRRATVTPCTTVMLALRHFYPRSPCGERPLPTGIA